jgi:RHS repeat-associated protein
MSRSYRSSLFLTLAFGVTFAALLLAPVFGFAHSTSSSLNEFDSRQFRAVPGLDEALVANGPTTAAENVALDKATRAFRSVSRSDGDFVDQAESLAAFAAQHPRSPWNTAIHTNLGLGYYRAGYFGKAIASFRSGWEAGKEATDPTVIAIADRALGELAVMYARVGESGPLAEVLKAADARLIRGPATELIASARESLWTFRHEPGGAYLCGPKALRNLLTALDFDADTIAAVDRIPSPEGGFSLAQVSSFARHAGLPHRLIRRERGADVPVPSVIHWKVSHFAAVLERKDGRYRVADPTFGGRTFWMTQAAIDAESSGYFLVPESVSSRPGWQLASADEAQGVHGKGSTAFNDQNSYKPTDDMLHPDDPSCGMCRANAMLMLVSTHLTDTPVGYRPAKGPSALVRLTYNQREGNFPASFNYFNVGPKWGINFLSFVEDNPNDIYVALKRYEIEGGVIQYPSYSMYGMFPDGTQGWAEPRTGNAIRRVPPSGPVQRYELLRPDGGKYIYDRADGATSGLRRMFLSRIIDPAGNSMTLNYDNELRLTSLTDASGRNTVFTYITNTRRIASINDPFGRRAILEYNANGHLSAIVDVLGMRSSFSYEYFSRSVPPLNIATSTPGGYEVHAQAGTVPWFSNEVGMPGGPISRGEYLVTSMTTPYGTTRFSFGWNDTENSRFLNITDPLGQTERLEFRHKAPSIMSTEPDASGGVLCPNCFNNYLEYRNTFYWDKNAYRVANGDYKKAKIFHWRHADENTTSGILESVKSPLHSRIVYEYADVDKFVKAVSQQIDDGTVRSTRVDREFSGFPTRMYDAMSREYNFEYDYSQGSPLLARVSARNNPMASFTYNTQKRPIAYTDAAGQVSSFTYNAAGQITSAADPLGNTTSSNYDSLGRLTTITNAAGVTQSSFAYDALDRIATATDSEGYTLAYSYDAMNRITRITYPDGTTTDYAYDRLDVSSIKDRLGRATHFVHDGNRKLIQQTNPLSRAITYAYHENGVLKSITDPKGNVTSWDIDIEGRPTVKRYADGTIESYAYEPRSGRLHSSTDARGYAKTYSYNSDDTVSAISYSAASGTPNVSFDYDVLLPRVVAMRDGIGESRLSYGPFGQIGANKLVQEDGPYSNDTIDYTYDALGRVVSRTIDSATETFAYDSLGRMVKNVNALGAFDMRYLGQTRQIVSMASPKVGTTWSYLGNIGDRRLDAIGQIGAGRGFSYTTNAENAITGMKEGVSGAAFTQAWSYSYDAADRLTSALAFTGGGFSWAYDAADNLTSIGGLEATYNAVNQIQTLGSVQYSNDAAGNVLGDVRRTYKWDAENRLIKIGYKAEPGRTSTFRYDGLGRRLAIVEASTGGEVETRFLWCGGATPCQARNANDTTASRFYQQGVAVRGGTKIYYSRDQLGSVRDVLDAGTGALISSHDYAPYGGKIAAGSPVDFGFAGMFNHQASGLNLTLFRAYDSSSGRWLSRDPIGERLTTNLFAYVDGNPINMRDRLGLSSDSSWWWDPDLYSWSPPLLPPGTPSSTHRRRPGASSPGPTCGPLPPDDRMPQWRQDPGPPSEYYPSYTLEEIGEWQFEELSGRNERYREVNELLSEHAREGIERIAEPVVSIPRIPLPPTLPPSSIPPGTGPLIWAP